MSEKLKAQVDSCRRREVTIRTCGHETFWGEDLTASQDRARGKAAQFERHLEQSRAELRSVSALLAAETLQARSRRTSGAQLAATECCLHAADLAQAVL